MASRSTPGRLETAREGDRPRAHDGATDSEAMIFAATERLLERIPLHELSVANIIDEAGVSRATFYFYFSSKYAPLTGLLAWVMGEVYATFEAFIGRAEGAPGEATLRRGLTESATVFHAHRMVLRATIENWHKVPELRALWLDVVERLTGTMAAEIERERAAGNAPPGPPARQLAAALVWASERCLYVAGLGADDDLPSEADISATLVILWVRGIYGARSTA